MAEARPSSAELGQVAKDGTTGLDSGRAEEILAEQRKSTSAPSSPKRIVLTGFMGAGKSTVGPLLAQRLDWRFLDVDRVIESETGATIADLFHQHGESWFRELEHQTVRRLLQSGQIVLALGGGAIETPLNRDLFFQSHDTVLVHLEASLDTVRDRCRGTEESRPILQDHANLEARYYRRLPLYRTAHLTVQVDSLPPHEVVAAILNEYHPLLISKGIR